MLPVMSMSDAFLPVDDPGRQNSEDPVVPDARMGIEPGDDEPDVLTGPPEPDERADVEHDDPGRSAAAGGGDTVFQTPEPGNRMHPDELRAELTEE